MMRFEQAFWRFVVALFAMTEERMPECVCPDCESTRHRAGSH